jgi:hypothetical protein
LSALGGAKATRERGAREETGGLIWPQPGCDVSAAMQGRLRDVVQHGRCDPARSAIRAAGSRHARPADLRARTLAPRLFRRPPIVVRRPVGGADVVCARPLTAEVV